MEHSRLGLGGGGYLVFLQRHGPTHALIAGLRPILYQSLYNNQINDRALIGQLAVGYCAGKPTEKSRVF